MIKQKLKVILLIFILPMPNLYAQTLDQLNNLLERRGKQLLQSATTADSQKSDSVFNKFVRAISQDLQPVDAEVAEAISNYRTNYDSNPVVREAMAAITSTFALEFYEDEIITCASELIRFRTYNDGTPNRTNPEFQRQSLYIRRLAEKLDLSFRDIDGYVSEISIGEGRESFGMMSHSDVQPVDTTSWHTDPWGGVIKNGALWGRGSVDDKTPIAILMYGMRALLDTGLPFKKKIVLLVGTDEESTNEDVTYYLKSNKAPDNTIIVDSQYPVVCAEKGWCGLWLKLPLTSAEPHAHGSGFLIQKIQSGISVSVVPGKANATVKPVGLSMKEASVMLEEQISRFHKERQGSDLKMTASGNQIILSAKGRSVHSSVPETGHNALMDLLVFLDKYVNPLSNNAALMAKFASTYVGFELNGESLGIAHHHDFMGDVTVAGNLFETDEDSVMFMFNFRIPVGISEAKINDEFDKRVQEFSQRYNLRFSEKRLFYDKPLYTDPQRPFVKKLLSIYNRLTGENAKARSIGGSTYAKRIPNSALFGPALPHEEYLGHQPNEHMKLSTISRNIEILTFTLFEFAFQQD